MTFNFHPVFVVIQLLSHVRLCNPMNRSTPDFPVLHHLPEFTQTDVHWVSEWCHPTISSSVVPFSSCPQSFPASRSFLMSQLFTSGGASASAAVLPMNTQDWFPLGLYSSFGIYMDILSLDYFMLGWKKKKKINKLVVMFPGTWEFMTFC